MSSRKKMGVWLMLSLPILAMLRVLVQFILFVITKFVDGGGGGNNGMALILGIKSLTNWVLGLFALLGVAGFIIGLILVLTGDKKTGDSDLDCDGERFVANMIDSGLMYLVIPIFFNIYYYFTSNDSIGRKVMGIKITNLEKEKPNSGQLVGRFFAKILSFMIFYMGCIWILFDKKHQGWHDKLANTLTIKYRKSHKLLATVLVLISILLPIIVSLVSE